MNVESLYAPSESALTSNVGMMASRMVTVSDVWLLGRDTMEMCRFPQTTKEPQESSKGEREREPTSEEAAMGARALLAQSHTHT